MYSPMESTMSEVELLKALLIVDVSNLYYTVKKNFGPRSKLIYEKYCNNIAQDATITKAIAYGADLNQEASRFKTVLHSLGFETKYKRPKIYRTLDSTKQDRKADWDVGMAMDVVRMAADFDVIVFGTADGDLAPCIEYVREFFPTKECWVYASGISRELKLVAQKWREVDQDDVE